MTSTIPIVKVTDAAGFPEPPGTKFLHSRCKPSLASNRSGPGQASESDILVLVYDNLTFWPLCYEDAHRSFPIAVTADSSKPMSIFEVEGITVIDHVEVSLANETIDFIGPDSQIASISWNNLSASAISHNTISKFPTTNVIRDTDGSDLENELGAGLIAGIVVGSVFGVMLTIIVGGYLYWRIRLRRKRKDKVQAPLFVPTDPRTEDPSTERRSASLEQQPLLPGRHGGRHSRDSSQSYGSLSNIASEVFDADSDTTIVASNPNPRKLQRTYTSFTASSVGSNLSDRGMGPP